MKWQQNKNLLIEGTTIIGAGTVHSILIEIKIYEHLMNTNYFNFAQILTNGRMND